MSEKICKNCSFWTRDGDTIKGECRAHPPQVAPVVIFGTNHIDISDIDVDKIITHLGKISGIWPLVLEDCLACGIFVPVCKD